jgi:hypothetical protein
LFIPPPFFFSTLSFSPPILPPFVCHPPPVFIGKEQGREAGAATVQLPHDCPRRHVSFIFLTHGRPRVRA